MNSNHIETIESHDNQNPNMEETYTVYFFGQRIHTTVTATPSVVRVWLYNTLRFHRSRRHKLVVGLGVQWNPDNGIPATLQLCIGSNCLIFQLLYANHVPASLRRFLNDPRNTFVGVWNSRDASMLLESQHRLAVSRIIDLRNVAAAWRNLRRNVSMETLAEVLLGIDGVKKPEWVGRSEWDAEWLDLEQVEYACVDVVVSFLLGKELEAWDWGYTDMV